MSPYSGLLVPVKNSPVTLQVMPKLGTPKSLGKTTTGYNLSDCPASFFWSLIHTLHYSLFTLHSAAGDKYCSARTHGTELPHSLPLICNYRGAEAGSIACDPFILTTTLAQNIMWTLAPHRPGFKFCLCDSKTLYNLYTLGLCL